MEVYKSTNDRIKCPHCGSHNILAIYRPEIYEFDYVCKHCEKGFNN